MTHATIDHLVTRVLDLAARTAPSATPDAEQQSFDDHLAAARPNAAEDRPKEERNRDEPDVAPARRYDDGPKPDEARAEHPENRSESDDATEQDVYDEVAPKAADDSASQEEDAANSHDETLEEDEVAKETNGEAPTDTAVSVKPNELAAVAQVDSESASEKAEEQPKSPKPTSDVQPNAKAGKGKAKGIGPSEGEPADTPARPIERPTETVAANVSDEIDQAATNQESADQNVSKPQTTQSQAEAAKIKAVVDDTEAVVTQAKSTAQQEAEYPVESTKPRAAASDRAESQENVSKRTAESPDKLVEKNRGETPDSTHVASSQQASVSNPQPDVNEQPAAKKPAKTKRAAPIDKPTKPTQPVRPAVQTSVQPVAAEATGLPEAATGEATKDIAQQPAPTVPSSSSVAPTSATPDRTPLVFQQLTAEKTTDRPPVTEAQAARFLQRVAGAVRSASQGDGEVRLRLHPPELGSLRMQIKVEDGVMIARLETETQHARQLLLDNLPALRDRLAGQDIRIDRFDVDVQDQSTGNRQHQTEDRENRSNRETRSEENTNQQTTTDEANSEQEQPGVQVVDTDHLNVVI